MKNKSIISLLLLLMGVSVITTSCEDMLTPDLERYAEKSGQDTLYSYWGILKSMQNIAERYVVLGESRGDLVSTDIYTNDSVGRLYNFEDPQDGESAFLSVADYYKVINGCNFYLAYADTASLKNNVYYMRKEYAQVQAMRAWTYLQLVQNYGSVPFITEPVRNTADGISLEKNAQRATASNLVTLLREAGLDRAEALQDEYGYPSYGSYSTGNGNIASRSCFIPVPLVLADLYLLAGQYEDAATKYYKYLQAESPKIPVDRVSWNENERNGEKTYEVKTGGWVSRYKNYSANSTNDLSVMIPAASNRFFGTTMTSIQNVYGFKTSSTNSTSSSRDEDETSSDDETISKSGSISVTADPTYLQLVPSNSYIGLNNAQNYCAYGSSASGSEVIEYYPVGDARLEASAPRHENTVGNSKVTNRFIMKSCPGSVHFNYSDKNNYGSSYSIYYGVQIYRKSIIALHYAEAINRAGFPEHAFAILKDGLAYENLPSLKYKDTLRYNVDDLGDTTSIDTVTVPYLVDPTAETGGASYIDLAEKLRANEKPYMNFNDAAFNVTGTYGIHSFGCGDTRGSHDTIFTFDKAVAGKLIDAQAEAQGWDERTIYEKKTALGAKGIMNAVADGEYTSLQVIEAVEDLIIDELALESAFEGNRYPDLLRFAAHKGSNNVINNEWLANKIARRGYAPSEKGRDEALYNKLVTGNYWYLSLPKE